MSKNNAYLKDNTSASFPGDGDGDCDGDGDGDCGAHLKKDSQLTTKPEKKLKLSLLLKIVAVLMTVPLLILIKLISLVVPQQKWEDFWDQFLE